MGERALEPLLTPLFGFLPAGHSGLTQGGLAVVLAYAIMTALHVVVGELMPKSIALQQPDKVSLLVGRPMTVIARLFTPLIWMLFSVVINTFNCVRLIQLLFFVGISQTWASVPPRASHRHGQDQ